MKRAKEAGTVDDLPRAGRPRVAFGKREAAEEKLRKAYRRGSSALN